MIGELRLAQSLDIQIVLPVEKRIRRQGRGECLVDDGVRPRKGRQGLFHLNIEHLVVDRGTEREGRDTAVGTDQPAPGRTGPPDAAALPGMAQFSVRRPLSLQLPFWRHHSCAIASTSAVLRPSIGSKVQLNFREKPAMWLRLA